MYSLTKDHNNPFDNHMFSYCDSNPLLVALRTSLFFYHLGNSERKAETKKRIAKRLPEILGEFNRIDASEKVRSSYLKLNEEVSKCNLPDNKSMINQKAIKSAVKN